ncbi:hypothetical protein CP49_37595 [Bradyrhizobium valentinum]|uniref:AMP-dependent synthetase/ligase domain-containing protein n=1 Tax=Bradyrhizobium valentinum TaxID=1518501 RepID=A0A0R3LLV0_9BRAD|nr:hypothetical protein CP49_37595 [Bradyrhizobium valentinum]
MTPKQIDRMTQHLQNLLCAVIADAQQPVARVELLSSEERAYLLEELNRTAAPYPSERCIHELFEAQVRQAPDAMAVTYADDRLSYGELNARANRLAHHLIALGVRPDQPVAICLQRSPAMVVGLLAILKAGGAYLPLDPAHPPARLRQVLKDAAPQLVLADAAGRAALGDVGVDVRVVDLATATPPWANLPGSDPDVRALGLTEKQGHYLAFIHTYSYMFGQPPAEADIQRHFRVSPPTVHQMIVTLERNGFIRRQPGVPRSIEILLPPENLPILEWLGIKTSKSL